MNSKRAKRLRQLARLLMDQGGINSQPWCAHTTDSGTTIKNITNSDGESRSVPVKTSAVVLTKECGKSLYHTMKKRDKQSK